MICMYALMGLCWPRKAALLFRYRISLKWNWPEDCYVTFHFSFDNCCFYDSGLCCPFVVSNNSSPSRYIPIKSFVLGFVSITKSLITSKGTLGDPPTKTS